MIREVSLASRIDVVQTGVCGCDIWGVKNVRTCRSRVAELYGRMILIVLGEGGGSA